MLTETFLKRVWFLNILFSLFVLGFLIENSREIHHLKETLISFDDRLRDVDTSLELVAMSEDSHAKHVLSRLSDIEKRILRTINLNAENEKLIICSSPYAKGCDN